MKKTIVLLTVLALWLTACGQKEFVVKGKSIEKENFDTTCTPCDDFYKYTNGGWMANNPIPPAFSRWGAFNELIDQTNGALRSIVEDAMKNPNAKPGTNLQKVGDFYFAAMDSVKIESDGIKGIESDLKKADAIKSTDDIAVLLSDWHLFQMAPVFNITAAQDEKNSAIAITIIMQGGLGMPDRDYYFGNDEKATRDAYILYMTKLFALSGTDAKKAADMAKTVMTIETQLAKASKTLVEQRDPEANYHKMSVDEVKKLAPNFAWDKYLVGLGLSAIKEINVSQPDFIKEVGTMMKSVKLEDWKTYLRFHMLNYAAPHLSSVFVNASFEFNGKTLTGQKEIQPRWKRMTALTDNHLIDAIGQLYSEKYFPASAKAKALEMVNNMKEAFRDRITKLDWMSDSTRARALAKLNTFRVRIGYTDKWRDYSKLEVSRVSHIANVMNSERLEGRLTLDDAGKPVDRDRWPYSAATVNASYNPTRNDITFPAGILQYPYFNPGADEAVNYGGIGAVIGHEMTHGFDDQGSQYDADGNLKSWWSDVDRKKFTEKADRVVNQFDSYVAIDTLHINGKQTLGENIADLGGVTIAYHALQKVLAKKPMGKISGFTPEQRFFMSWSQVWRTNIRDQRLRLQVKTDVHSPGLFRGLGPLTNLDVFAKAFGCKDGDKMVRPESVRAVIW